MSDRKARENQALAIRSTNRVRDIAKDPVLRSNEFCQNLCTALPYVKKELEQNENQGAAQLQRVKRLLDRLELLCTWPSPLPKHTPRGWQTLERLNLPKFREAAAKSLQRLAKSREEKGIKFRADTISYFNDFSASTLKRERAKAGFIEETSPPLEQSGELDYEIQHLCRILRQYRACKTEEPPSEIVPYIRLNSYRSIGTSAAAPRENARHGASAEFGILFLDHPHAYDGNWQEANLQIRLNSQSLPAKPRDGVVVRDSSAPAGSPDDRGCMSCEHFCNHISQRNHDLLCFAVYDEGLSYHRRADTSREWLGDLQARSLERLLSSSDTSLLDKSKAVLALLVAKATWQFYGSEMIGPGLTSDRIYFVWEERSGVGGVWSNEPLLQAQLPESSARQQNCCYTEMIHDNPQILALGILLLELETRKPMKKHRENAQAGINTDYKIARSLISDSHENSILDEIHGASPLRHVLPLCILPGQLDAVLQKKLLAGGRRKLPAGLGREKFMRRIIHDEIVKPIEKWALAFHNLDKVNPLCKISDTAFLPGPPRPTSPPVLPDPTVSDVGKEHSRSSEEWFGKCGELLKHLRGRSSSMMPPYKPVKIAILDTGMNQDRYQRYRDSYEADKSYASFEYKDFVSPGNGIAVDETGHGSTALDILDKMCPNAHYFVARVLRGAEARLNDAAAIASAIDWAIGHNVDIITMAIGFKSAQEQIVAAIGRAFKRDILIFSGASNKGNLERVYCPANMTDKVFGIFATEANNRECRSLNPSPLPGCLAAFGHKMVIDGSDSPKTPKTSKTGCSYSTSVAAGFAAALLDFSRQDREENDRSPLSKLNEKIHMEAILKSAAVVDNGYHCIVPWNLLKQGHNDRNTPAEELRALQRNWIRSGMERQLSN